jgi:hypothetical protein
MLMPYLPKEKILVNANLNSAPQPRAQPPMPTPGMQTLYQNMLKLRSMWHSMYRSMGASGRMMSF